MSEPMPFWADFLLHVVLTAAMTALWVFVYGWWFLHLIGFEWAWLFWASAVQPWVTTAFRLGRSYEHSRAANRTRANAYLSYVESLRR